MARRATALTIFHAVATPCKSLVFYPDLMDRNVLRGLFYAFPVAAGLWISIALVAVHVMHTHSFIP